MTYFLLIDSEFIISSYFCLNATFPPISENLLFLPTLVNFSPISLNIRAFCILYVFFISPYCDHGAFKHHIMHVLDDPGALWLSHWLKI